MRYRTEVAATTPSGNGEAFGAFNAPPSFPHLPVCRCSGAGAVGRALMSFVLFISGSLVLRPAETRETIRRPPCGHSLCTPSYQVGGLFALFGRSRTVDLHGRELVIEEKSVHRHGNNPWEVN